MKWVLAIVLTLGVIGAAKLETMGVINKPVTQFVTTGDDFLVMKKWIASMMKDPVNDKIMVMSDPHHVAPLYCVRINAAV